MTGETIRVLLVDDNPDDAAILRHTLGRFQGASFQVLTVRSADHLVERVKSDTADLVLLDYVLPGEDGLSALRRLTSIADLPPVIMITGHGDARTAVEAMRCGAYDYFPKDAITSEQLGRAMQEALEHFRREGELHQFDEQIMVALAAAAEGKDPETHGHLERITRYALLLGRELSLDEHELLVLRFGAVLHDIGKLAVTTSVLRKPGPLSEIEWEEIRQHPLVGERLCAPLRFAREVGPIIRHHHERWDGSGYVDGLSSEEIPLLARVVSVVDAFDAMSSDRPYRRALSPHETIRRLADGAGTQWDPEVIQAFLELVEGDGLGSGLAMRARRSRAA